MTRYSGPVTPRQAEILCLVAEGFTNQQVGAALGVSEQTVKGHLGAIFKRLDVVDRTTAVVAAMSFGVVPVPVSVGRDTWTAS